MEVFHASDEYCMVPVFGMGGSAEGDVAPGLLLELDPPDAAEDFRVLVADLGATVSYFAKTRARAIARRGSVYSLRSTPGVQENGSDGLELVRIPRSVLPAYSPG
mmetsp:Transcript_166850/g.530496  ORF Transcript_166850/g.530496 Transcript_166850/m.530496 type:complete len:105 (-) Transcript_166850:38-352(-)